MRKNNLPGVPLFDFYNPICEIHKNGHHYRICDEHITTGLKLKKKLISLYQGDKRIALFYSVENAEKYVDEIM